MHMQVAKVLSCLPSPSPWVARVPLQAMETASNPLSKKAQGTPISASSITSPTLTVRSVAEVTISLKNQEEEAYKPKEYGKSIIITCRFTKEGSSSWKIKSKSGTVISTKKDELSAICDHMNIQVDNPMDVLTQGSCPLPSRLPIST